MTQAKSDILKRVCEEKGIPYKDYKLAQPEPESKLKSVIYIGHKQASVQLDGTKVVMTCTNCEHIMKTVDLKEGL